MRAQFSERTTQHPKVLLIPTTTTITNFIVNLKLKRETDYPQSSSFLKNLHKGEWNGTQKHLSRSFLFTCSNSDEHGPLLFIIDDAA